MLTVACHDCRGCPRSEAPEAGNAGTSNDGCDELRPRGSTILDVDVIARGKTHLPAERLTCAHGLARFQDHTGFEREPLIGPIGDPAADGIGDAVDKDLDKRAADLVFESDEDAA